MARLADSFFLDKRAVYEVASCSRINRCKMNQKSMAEKLSEWPICCGLLCEGWSDNSKLGVHCFFVVSLLS